MQLKTDYREKTTGVLKGTKEYFLVCNVTFSDEERATIQDRGLYDETVEVPAETPPSTRGRDFGRMMLAKIGLILIPVGLVSSCATGLAHSDASAPLFFICVAGIVLFVVAKIKDRAAIKRYDSPDQTITLRQLLTNPEFLIWAPALDVAKIYEEQVRDKLQNLAHIIRQNIVVPEQNIYKL